MNTMSTATAADPVISPLPCDAHWSRRRCSPACVALADGLFDGGDAGRSGCRCAPNRPATWRGSGFSDVAPGAIFG